MFKIPAKLSVGLSFVIALAFIIVLITGAIMLPELINILISFLEEKGIMNQISNFDRGLILTISYLMVILAFLADIFLIFLLKRVNGGKVFTAQSVSLIRGVSWCVLIIGVFFALLGYYLQTMLIVAFAMLFLGLCLRVVKNVIEEATDIKSENDLTV